MCFNGFVMEDVPQRKGTLAVGVLFVFLSIAIVSFVLARYQSSIVDLANRFLREQSQIEKKEIGFKKFASEEEFNQYLREAEKLQNQGLNLFGIGTMLAVPEAAMRMETDTALSIEGKGGGAERVSETNVQVKGIDEPDILKTNGQQIFAFLDGFYGVRPMQEPIIIENEKREIAPGMIMPPRAKPGIAILEAFPPEELAELSQIEADRELLLSDKILIVLNQKKIVGYDVSNPQSPAKSWTLDFDSRTRYLNARLSENELYLITRTEANRNVACPFNPFDLDGREISVACNQIYHPIIPLPIDSTYSIAKINPQTGVKKDSIEFVAPAGQTVIYMTKDNIFVSYSYQEDPIKFFSGFFQENSDLVSKDVSEKLANLQDLNISQVAKTTEMNVIWQNFLASLSNDERLELENELQNKVKVYEETHLRDFSSTGINRITLNPMEFKASGSVPGKLLNQFSLDYHQDHLRVVTTIQSNWWLPGIRSSQVSVNDLYVLDSSLNQVGQVTDLGKGERIYSARFMGDLGYLVTFKQIDPFFVFDLKDPRKPRKTGELKIPGYSSYLHPLKEGFVLGIGREDGKVKLSLFDVRNINYPQEIDKYFLTENYIEALDNHHAFLQDEQKQLFFIPGNQGGYVFSYKNNILELEKAIADIRAKRTLYLDDYLYILGEEKLVVYSQKTWDKVNQLTF